MFVQWTRRVKTKWRHNTSKIENKIKNSFFFVSYILSLLLSLYLLLKRVGFTPDVVAEATLEGLRLGRDEVLGAALRWCREQHLLPAAAAGAGHKNAEGDTNVTNK